MDWRAQVRTVDYFHCHYGQSLHGRNWSPNRGVYTGTFRPGPFSSWGCTAISSVPREPPWGAGKVGQPTSQPLFRSLGKRCRGQACSEPAGCLPHASPASQTQVPTFHSLWLHILQCSFWWKQMQLAQTNSPSILFLTCCCQNSVRRNKRQT